MCLRKQRNFCIALPSSSLVSEKTKKQQKNKNRKPLKKHPKKQAACIKTKKRNATRAAWCVCTPQIRAKQPPSSCDSCCSEVRLYGLQWDLSCVCGNLRLVFEEALLVAAPLCASFGSLEKRGKRSQGIFGIFRIWAERHVHVSILYTLKRCKT